MCLQRGWRAAGGAATWGTRGSGQAALGAQHYAACTSRQAQFGSPTARRLPTAKPPATRPNRGPARHLPTRAPCPKQASQRVPRLCLCTCAYVVL